MAILNASEMQPNSDKRNELFIVLDYLLHHTSDEKHATSQTSIVKYAKAEYGVEMRRDRIPQILLHLSQLTEKYPDKFPFKLKTVMPKSATGAEDGARRKYYISERAFSDKEILKIVSAIQSDKTISNEKTNELVDKFLRETASEKKTQELKKKLAKKQRKSSKFTERGMDYLERVEEMAASNETIWFTIRDFQDVDFDCPRFVAHRVMKDEAEHRGYIYSIKEVNNKFVLIIYLSDYKHVMITPTTNIVIVRHMDLTDINQVVDYPLDNRKYASIDEWVEKHYKGQDGLLITFKFKFTLEDLRAKDFEYIDSSFRKHWKQAMNYETVEREAEIVRMNDNGGEVVGTRLVHDGYVTIRTTRESFEHWYKDYKILSKVVIVAPASFNDIILAPLMNRFARRISKYGFRYDYKVSRTVKPEYQEFLDNNKIVIRERINKIKERIDREEMVTEGLPRK